MGVLPVGMPEEGPRSRRAAILAIASRFFGEKGYDATRWSTVAEEVGIGQTALYHYFESKAHCLLTIMRLQLEQSSATFDEATKEAPDPLTAVRTALARVYDVDTDDILRLRVLHSNLAVLATPRVSTREEAERQAARALVRDFESAWAELLARAMAAGQVPDRDPRQLARALLGLVVSVWGWFNPRGDMTIADAGSFTAECGLRLIGRSA